ncbi:MAG: 7-carboxy-7-deazaguanine synthase QueE [Deltaproteobacteria bacterium]|nr:7-carboxy-7-deazaguanine synthase QueE [Deltaproteobacteria bacterium]
MNSKQAKLVEIFSSIQGEGMHIGSPMTFVRFQACALKCIWCDTPDSFIDHPQYRVEENAYSNEWAFFDNPVTSSQLTHWIHYFKNSWVSLTGGEPLQQVDFLEQWLPTLPKLNKIFLETSGVMIQAMKKITPYIQCVSMDFKLPSSAQTGSFWEQHRAFLEVARSCPELYVKIVITAHTVKEEIEEALQLIRSIDSNIPLILQPASPTATFHDLPEWTQISHFAQMASDVLKEVRVIPQTHKLLGIA